MKKAIIFVEKNIENKGYTFIAPDCAEKRHRKILEKVSISDDLEGISEERYPIFRIDGFIVIKLVCKDTSTDDPKALTRSPKLNIYIILDCDIKTQVSAYVAFIERCKELALAVKNVDDRNSLSIEVPESIIVQKEPVKKAKTKYYMCFALTLFAMLFAIGFFFKGEDIAEEAVPVERYNAQELSSKVKYIRTHLKKFGFYDVGDDFYVMNKFFEFYSKDSFRNIAIDNPVMNVDCEFATYLKSRFSTKDTYFTEENFHSGDLKEALDGLSLSLVGVKNNDIESLLNQIYLSNNFKAWYLSKSKVKYDGVSSRNEGVYNFAKKFFEISEINEQTRLASSYYEQLQDWKVNGLVEEDSVFRAYYVLGSFFEYLSLERFDNVPPQLYKVFPKEALIKRDFWAKDFSKEELDTAYNKLLEMAKNDDSQSNKSLKDLYRENKIILKTLEELDKSKDAKLIDFLKKFNTY